MNIVNIIMMNIHFVIWIEAFRAARWIQWYTGASTILIFKQKSVQHVTISPYYSNTAASTAMLTPNSEIGFPQKISQRILIELCLKCTLVQVYWIHCRWWNPMRRNRKRKFLRLFLDDRVSCGQIKANRRQL